MSKYLHELATAFSKLLNAAVTGNRNQTLSARCYEAAIVQMNPYWVPALVVIDFLLGKDHCKNSFNS